MSKPPILLTVSFLIIVLGFRLFFFFQEKPGNIRDGQLLNFETTLFFEPKISGRTQKLAIDYNSNRIFITAPLFPEFHYGDTIAISGTLRVKLLNNKNTLYSISFPKIEAKNGNRNPLLAVASFIRQRLILFFNKYLSPNLAGLMLGIVFGIKEGIPKDFFGDLRQVDSQDIHFDWFIVQ